MVQVCRIEFEKKELKENQKMKRKEANSLAIVFSTIGILFFISFGLQLLPFKYAIFGGVACFIVAGMVRRLGNVQG